MSATFVVTPEPLATPPRMRLDVTTSGAGVSVNISRLDPDGRTLPVRLADPGVMTGTAWVGYDYESAFGASVTYTAAITYTGGPTTLTAVATLDVADVWLIHPGIPAISMLLGDVQSLGDRTRPVSRGVFSPYGRETPLVVTDGRRKAVQASLEVRTQTPAEQAALIALTSDTSVLLLNVPVALGWGVANEYISLGDLNESREADSPEHPFRLFTAPYYVVSRPVGGSQSQRTWLDVMAESATWQAVLDRHRTWLDVLAPTGAEIFGSSGLYDGTAAGFVEDPAGSHLYLVP